MPVSRAVMEKGQKEAHSSLIQLHHVPNLPGKEASYEVWLYCTSRRSNWNCVLDKVTDSIDMISN